MSHYVTFLLKNPPAASPITHNRIQNPYRETKALKILPPVPFPISPAVAHSIQGTPLVLKYIKDTQPQELVPTVPLP